MIDPDTGSARTGPARSLLFIAAAILVILVGWVLHATAVIAVPIAFALFLAVILAPIENAIAARLPGRLAFLARGAVLALLLVVLAVFFAGLVYSARQVIAEVPAVQERLSEYLPASMPEMTEIEQAVERSTESETTAPPTQTAEGGGARGDGATEDDGASARQQGDDPAGMGLVGTPLRESFNRVASTAGTWIVEYATGLARTVAGAVGSFVAATVIVVFLVLLALGETRTWQRKVASLWPGRSDDWDRAFGTISHKLRGFLLVRAAMGALSAALYVGWLWIFDIGLLPVWAVLTFLLGFVPNLGSVISGTLPTLYALLTQDLKTALLAGVGLFVIEQVIGNWVDPRLQGRQIAISPIVVLISILVWGWIWGAAGAILAVPMMVAVMVACGHVRGLQPIALLLSNLEDEARLARSLETDGTAGQRRHA